MLSDADILSEIESASGAARQETTHVPFSQVKLSGTGHYNLCFLNMT